MKKFIPQKVFRSLVISVIFFALIFLNSCSSSIDDYVDSAPDFQLFEFFEGKTKAWGMVQDFSGHQIRRFQSGKRHAGIGEGEQGQHQKGCPGVQKMLEMFERRTAAAFGVEGYCQRRDHASKGRMDAGFQNAYPEEYPDQYIGRGANNA